MIGHQLNRRRKGALVQPTPHDWATALVLEEVARREAGDGNRLLGVDLWRTAWDVRCITRHVGRENLPASVADMSAGLDYLAMRGLVEERVSDAAVERGEIQLYRWSRAATDDTLARFAAPPRVRSA